MFDNVKNVENNRKVLDNLQNTPNQELVAKSKHCLNVVKQEHDWNRIIDNILGALNEGCGS